LREQVRRLKRAQALPGEQGSLLGASRAMQAVHDLVRRVAPADTMVLLSGESGTGKELVARALHEQSTLLLDEIGEMSLDMQPKLLRVLQERQVRPVGGNTTIPVRARILAATNRDLEGEVVAKRFREDLFYRLNVVQIAVPPLRARGNDVLLLAEHFVRVFAARTGKAASGIDPDAQRKLLDFDWPGNVRQLEN
jgi:DNA-binding NtrC family response regulator